MPHRKIRKLREGVQSKKEAARESAEQKREKLRRTAKRAASTKRRAERKVAKVTVPIEHEARETARETRLLAREVTEPASRAAKAGRSAARAVGERVEDVQDAGSGIREKASELDRKMERVREIEADTLGNAGEDFGTDLEIVDDLERGEEMDGMGDVGMDTTFDEFDAPLSERLPGADEATFEDDQFEAPLSERLAGADDVAFDEDIFDETHDGLEPDLDAIDEDIIGDMEDS